MLKTVEYRGGAVHPRVDLFVFMLLHILSHLWLFSLVSKPGWELRACSPKTEDGLSWLGSFTAARIAAQHSSACAAFRGSHSSLGLGRDDPFLSLQDLGVNSLEQLCINFANEHLQWFFSQTVIAQEEVSGISGIHSTS